MKHTEINIQNISTNWDKNSDMSVRLEGIVPINNKSNIKFIFQDGNLTLLPLNEEHVLVEIEKSIKIMLKNIIFGYIAGYKQENTVNGVTLEVENTTMDCSLEE